MASIGAQSYNGSLGIALRGSPWGSWWHFCIGKHFCAVLQLVVAAGLTEVTRQRRTFDKAIILSKRRWYLPFRRALRFSTSSVA